ncbi:MAG: response regulator, partial [Chlamydiota bacterium]|nr:response regulator [Chlamydiota bacterium]
MFEREKILIVDDEEVNLIAFEKCLKSLDVDIVKVNSGEDALKMIFNEVFSLILLDIQMPHLSGFDVADRIQKDADNSNTPIVFISAYEQDREKVTKALYCGVVDFLSKPIDPDVLRFKVKSYLELSQLRKKTRDNQQDKVNILVVDDQENNIKAIEKNLIKTGLKVITATSGEEALYILQKNIFAAILIDIQI